MRVWGSGFGVCGSGRAARPETPPWRKRAGREGPLAHLAHKKQRPPIRSTAGAQTNRELGCHPTLTIGQNRPFSMFDSPLQPGKFAWLPSFKTHDDESRFSRTEQDLQADSLIHSYPGARVINKNHGPDFTGSLSLSLSLSRTDTHTHTHTLSLLESQD